MDRKCITVAARVNHFEDTRSGSTSQKLSSQVHAEIRKRRPNDICDRNVIESSTHTSTSENVSKTV